MIYQIFNLNFENVKSIFFESEKVSSHIGQKLNILHFIADIFKSFGFRIILLNIKYLKISN
ncbi:MAG: hypothetical protein BGO86_15620 [Chryseobacterium sp. 36-9]|nr:MAG: hypothetical protein BGO86_15620 [Chryseobacterium sp. 36-9]